MSPVRARVVLFGAVLAAGACARDASRESAADFGHAQSAIQVQTAGPASLIKAINTSGGSNPGTFVNVGGTVYFAAQTADLGVELWKTDGTATNTALAADVNPGAGSSNPSQLTAFGSNVVFIADDGTNGPSLFVSTSTGAQRVAAASAGSPVAVANKTVFFVGSDATNGHELWKWDGTTASLVTDINPGAADSSISSFAVVGNTVFFAADDGTHGVELWKTDGTAASLVLDINAGAAGSNPTAFAAVGSTLYFAADDGASGVELWSTDGTDAGTGLVDDINPMGSSNPTGLTVVGNTLYFAADDGTHGVELWKRDSSGSALVADINPAGDSSPSGFVGVNGVLVFAANDGTHGLELWKSTGTSAGTALLHDTNPGAGDGLVAPVQLLGLSDGVVLFAGDDGASGVELWETDGSSSGTALVQDVNPGAGSSNPSNWLRLGNQVLFSADDGSTGLQPWSVPVSALVVPSITCPAPYFVEATSAAGATVSYQGASATNGKASLSITFAPASSGVLPLGATSVSASTSNPLGGSAQCSFSVTVRDTTAPAVTCPSSVTVEATSPSGAKATFGAATAADVVTTNPTITYSQASGTTFPLGVTTVMVQATDAAKNVGQCSFNVTVQDTKPPTLKCPPPAVVEANSPGGAKIAAYPPAVTTDVASTPTLSYSPAAGSTLPLGTSFVVVTATDGSGNTAQCSFGVTVQDTTPPKITCPGDQTVEATSSTGAAVNFPLATARDTVSVPQVSYSQDPGTTFPLGSTTVTVTATDEAANSSICTFNVIVQDTTAPAVTCPANLTAEATSSSGATVSFADATVSDAVTSAPQVTYSQKSGTTFPLGATKVTVSATDDAMNKGTCSFTVTIKDTTAPELTCPKNISTEATSTQGAVVTYSPATATDAVTATPTIAYSQASGTAFPLGTTEVAVLAKDGAGNTADCRFNVTVQDTTPPQIVCPADVVAQATSSTGTFLHIMPAQASDAASAPTISYSPSLNAPFPMGTTMVTATAKDSSGNTNTCTFKVVVQDTQAPSILCPDTVTAEATSSMGATVSYPSVVAADPVSAATVTYSMPSGSLFPLGTTQVTATATDGAGNHIGCTFPVVVRDTTAPTIMCPASAMAEATSPEGTLIAYGMATAADAVSMPTIAYSHPATMPFGLGRTVVTATATDMAGNAASCSFIVTVQDTMPPAITCPADVNAEATSAAGAHVTYPAAMATDAASALPTVTADHASGSLFPLGTTKVTLTATDDAGNAATCGFNVSVKDSTAPSLVCPSDVTVQAISGSSANVAFTLPTAQDSVTASPTVTADHKSGDSFPVGTTTVEVTATDMAGNAGTCQFKVTVDAPQKVASGCSSSAPAAWALLVAAGMLASRRRRASAK